MVGTRRSHVDSVTQDLRDVNFANTFGTLTANATSQTVCQADIYVRYVDISQDSVHDLSVRRCRCVARGPKVCRLHLAKQMLSCSKNVVQVAANRGKLRIEGEQNGEKRLAAFCLNLPFSCGLRRLRQDLINSIPRFEGRCSIPLSYGRTLQSILSSITYSCFLKDFVSNFRCNRCNNGFFGQFLGRVESKSSYFCLR